jgi:hypothetical protein
MHELEFLIVGYLANQILSIMGSQIEAKWIFSIVRILDSKDVNLEPKT